MASSEKTGFDVAMSRSSAKSRVSAGYFATICAQAGYAFRENPPDTDALGRDGSVAFAAGDVHVQLKCTECELSASGLRVPIKSSWYRMWSDLHQPLYIVGLGLESGYEQWAEVYPDDEFTMVNAVAYWQRFERNVHVKSILLPRENFLSHHTIKQWSDELDSDFGGAV